MKNQFSLEIKTPCLENYNQFKPTAKGGFCDSCKTEVIDFTKMNTEDIISYLKNKSNQNTCGRFNSNQVSTITRNTKQQKKFGFFKKIGLACLSLFTFNTIFAQDVKIPTDNSGMTPLKTITSNYKKDITVKGNVTDDVGPLSDVSILLQGTTIGTATDFDGNFTFPTKLKKDDVLIFSYIGFKSQKIVISNENSVSTITLQIDMKMDSCFLLGKVAVKKVYSSKKNN